MTTTDVDVVGDVDVVLREKLFSLRQRPPRRGCDCGRSVGWMGDDETELNLKFELLELGPEKPVGLEYREQTYGDV